MIPIDIDRLSAEIDHLATFSDAPAPAVTRVLYSDADQRSRVWLRDLARKAGLTLREDGLGNLFARLPGTDPSLPAVATGSHTDAIPHAGKYDGVVGVLGGIEALRSIQAAGHKPARSIDVILFTAEEPTRFGIGCLGSRALAGVLTPDDLLALRDPDGNTLDDLRRTAGFDAPLADVQLPNGYYHAFVELHIEQGPRLEREKLQLGFVTSIAAPATLRAVLHGEGGHAGATLMPGRRDALAAAAEIVADVERAALDSESSDAVATVGLLQVHPGAVNSIPSQVRMEIDIRDTRLDTRDSMLDRVRVTIQSVCKRRDIRPEIDLLNADTPCQSGPHIVAIAEAIANRLGYSSKRLVSRAYHDTLFMARVCPTAMIFVPSENGYSHRPEEYTAPEDIARGVEVLAYTLAELANATP